MLVIPGQLESYRSLKDRSVKLSIETAEPTPDQMSAIQSNLMKTGFIAFSADMFTTEQKEILKTAKVDYNDSGKTPSQRLRSVLFVWWKEDAQGYEYFDDFYSRYIEKFIQHVKGKLDPIE